MKYNFKSPKHLCDISQPIIEKYFGKLTKRPWDRFRPDITPWWIIPTGNVVHYKNSKYFFSWTDSKQNKINAGYYIEKGLSENLSSVYSSKKAKNLIMNNTWTWFTFTEKIEESLKNITNPPSPITISISGGYITEPTEFDPYQEKETGFDRYSFIVHPATNTLALNESKRCSYILKLHNIKTLTDLSETLKQLTADEWLWLTIIISETLEINKPEDINELHSSKEAEELWLKFLSKFSNIFI